MKLKFITIILAVLLLISSVPAAAEATTADTEAYSDHVFTYEELGGMVPVDTSGMIADERGFVPVKNIQGSTTRDVQCYYITRGEDGKMLTRIAPNELCLSKYNDRTGDRHRSQTWIFNFDDDGVGRICPFATPARCLTIDPYTGNVYLSDYVGSPNQSWRTLYNTSDGYALQCASEESDCYGYTLVFDDNSCFVSDSEHTPTYFINTSFYVPCTSVSINDMELLVGESRNISPTFQPSDSTSHYSTVWTKYEAGNSYKIQVSSSGAVTALSTGTSTITVTHILTDVSDTANVYVSRPPNPDAQNKTNWCWAAAAKMVGEHNGGSGSLEVGFEVPNDTSGLIYNYCGINAYGSYTVDKGQRQIVMEITGNDGNNTAESVDDVEEAIIMSSNSPVEITILGNGRIANTELAALNAELLEGRWVVVAVSFGYSFVNSDHAVVFKSLDASKNEYTYWDPMTNQDYVITHEYINHARFTFDGNSPYYMSYVFICSPISSED